MICCLSFLILKYIQTMLTFTMKTGSITLKSAASDIVTVVFDGFGLSVVNRPESLKINATLASVKVLDKFTQKTCFPQLLSPLRSADEPYFTLAFDSKPTDSPFDYKLELRMLPLEIVYNNSCISNVGTSPF